jgi:hypothetical protein
MFDGKERQKIYCVVPIGIQMACDLYKLAHVAKYL